MSGITDPAQEYFKDGLWAWVTDQWKKLVGDAAGHLQVDVVDSGLPSGASTAAIQSTMLTALQSIQNLVGALHDVGVDELDINITSQSADVEVKQTTAADLTPGVMGWDGSAWRKLPLLFGYSGPYIERVSVANAIAGTNQLNGSTVPAGEIWVVKGAGALDIDSKPDKVRFRVYDDPDYAYIVDVFPATANAVGNLAVEVVLSPGWRLEAIFYGCTLNDDLYFDINGYKMKVAE